MFRSLKMVCYVAVLVTAIASVLYSFRLLRLLSLQMLVARCNENYDAFDAVPNKKYSLIHGFITLLNENRNTVVIPYMHYAKHNMQLGNTSSEQQPYSSLVVGVLSKSSNQDRRIFIRNTWGKVIEDRLFFLVSGENLTAELQQEMDQYHDIFYVQQLETYRWSLTPKTLAFFHSMSGAAGTMIPFQHLLKTDDDSYVHLDRLQAWLSKEKPHYGGHCSIGGPVIRNWKGPAPETKWYVSYKLYPGKKKKYPPYAQGAGYVLSRDATNCLSHSMGRVPFLPCEDTNTGRLLHDFCDAPLCVADYERFNLIFNESRANVAFVQHHLTTDMARQYHDLVMNTTKENVSA